MLRNLYSVIRTCQLVYANECMAGVFRLANRSLSRKLSCLNYLNLTSLLAPNFSQLLTLS